LAGRSHAGLKKPLSTPVGTIYFTLDGGDPRLPGGGISNHAELYERPIRPAGAHLKARVALNHPGDQREWSAVIDF